MEKNNKKNSTALKAVIVLLICLVLVSAVALAVNLFQRQAAESAEPTVMNVPESMLDEKDESSTSNTTSTLSATSTSAQTKDVSDDEKAVVSNRTSNGNRTASNNSNSSSSEQATTEVQASALLLYQGMPQANEKFQVQNMVPGDVETRYFCVRAYHNTDITLAFRTEVTDQTLNLGKVLNIKVTRLNDGVVLCDAPFDQVNKKEFSQKVETASDGKNDLYYQIDVSLDTSVGNEYQGAQLKADFDWYVTDQVKALAPLPQTGDTTELLLWSILAAGSSLLLVCIYFWRKKEASRNEYAK
ncbi:LPXTG cell wall anchor domain-containing protein [uncultured Ruthenibacterium sp.]|uniref:LPXTG cell wall anchor domain-containing protein n=1 Tax=uncultured Ruthenibacterium sp. TaxID=1905347 RepID=UPI00349E4B75